MEEASSLDIVVHHRGNAHVLTLPAASLDDVTLQDLSEAGARTLSVPPENQKFIFAPKAGLHKAPFPPTPLSQLFDASSPRSKITLLGSTAAEVSSVNSAAAQAQQRRAAPRYLVKPERPRATAPAAAASRWTFHSLRPLAHLPHPERSMRYLERLRDDPGIRRVMAKHQFSVSLLTEMDPVEHTTHDFKTLGLNRNKGEVIELRLRTDAYDGYRNYRVVRDTLCHELAHCVFSEHDRDFWELTKQIEREVDQNDYHSHGRALTEMEFYNPDKDTRDEAVAESDHGTWTGGQHVLGGQTSSPEQTADSLITRREMIARAAERRIRGAKPDEGTDEGTNGAAGSQGQ